MSGIVHLDPEIAGEGISVNNWTPGMAWTNAPTDNPEDWQPDIEAPRVYDYAAFKTHKHYGRYFRAYRYVPFPAWLYHPTLDAKVVQTKDDAEALIGADHAWRREPYPHNLKIDFTGKSVPGKSETLKLAEAISAGLAGQRGPAAPAIDPATIAAIVAAVIAALPQAPVASVPSVPPAPAAAAEGGALTPGGGEGASEDDPIDREAMLQLAGERGIAVGKRWDNARLKKELGLD